jgi:hypothetical protein
VILRAATAKPIWDGEGITAREVTKYANIMLTGIGKVRIILTCSMLLDAKDLLSTNTMKNIFQPKRVSAELKLYHDIHIALTAPKSESGTEGKSMPGENVRSTWVTQMMSLMLKGHNAKPAVEFDLRVILTAANAHMRSGDNQIVRDNADIGKRIETSKLLNISE